MKYQILTWHTCNVVPKKFWDMCEVQYEEVDGKEVKNLYLDLTAENFNEVMDHLKDHNIMIVNDYKVIWIDAKSRRFRQS